MRVSLRYCFCSWYSVIFPAILRSEIYFLCSKYDFVLITVTLCALNVKLTAFAIFEVDVQHLKQMFLSLSHTHTLSLKDVWQLFHDLLTKGTNIFVGCKVFRVIDTGNQIPQPQYFSSSSQQMSWEMLRSRIPKSCLCSATKKPFHLFLFISLFCY